MRAPVNGLWRMLVGKAARGSRRLLRAPIHGVRRRVRGPAAGPKPGLLADFHETQKTPVAGIISGATALSIHTACRRDALFSEFAVVSALKYIKYLECHGCWRSAPKLCCRLCFRPLSDRRWWLFRFLSRALPESPFLWKVLLFRARGDAAENPASFAKPRRRSMLSSSTDKRAKCQQPLSVHESLTHPQACIQVRLSGPCFKTGRVLPFPLQAPRAPIQPRTFARWGGSYRVLDSFPHA